MTMSKAQPLLMAVERVQKQPSMAESSLDTRMAACTAHARHTNGPQKHRVTSCRVFTDEESVVRCTVCSSLAFALKVSAPWYVKPPTLFDILLAICFRSRSRLCRFTFYTHETHTHTHTHTRTHTRINKHAPSRAFADSWCFFQPSF